MTTQYDSASFEADLDRVEVYLRSANNILDSDQFRKWIDLTWMNFSNTEKLVQQHEEIMFKIIEAKTLFDAFAERIRNLD